MNVLAYKTVRYEKRDGFWHGKGSKTGSTNMKYLFNFYKIYVRGIHRFYTDHTPLNHTGNP